MLESVLSPNNSVQNASTNIGGISSPSPNARGLKNDGSIHEDQDSNNKSKTKDDDDGLLEMEDGKENTVSVSVKNLEEEELDEPSSSSPKRAVEASQEDSPESDAKKARIHNDHSAVAEIDDTEDKPPTPTNESAMMTTTTTTEATWDSACSSKDSVKELFETLAKTKTALEESKNTLQQLKDQHQTLASNGETMSAKIVSFDQELAKLKEIHAENGKYLEKVLEVRDATKEAFDNALLTLRRVTEKSKAEDQKQQQDSAKKTTETTMDVETEVVKNELSEEIHHNTEEVEDSKSAEDEKVENDPIVKNEVREEIHHNTEEASAEDNLDDSKTAEEEVEKEPVVSLNDIGTVEEIAVDTVISEQANVSVSAGTVEAEEVAMLFQGGDDDDDAKAVHGMQKTDGFNDDLVETTLEGGDDDDDKVAHGTQKTNVFNIDLVETNIEGGDADDDDDKVPHATQKINGFNNDLVETNLDQNQKAKEVAITHATSTVKTAIDNTLALELQNDDGSDSDDSLISM